MGAPAPSRLLSQSPTVLVVEDTVVVRRMVLRALEGAGYTVCEAGDGAEALALLTQGARVDVIVADIRMPRMDGRQLAVEMRKQSSPVPILFISGYDAYVGQGDLPGPVLAKPFMPEQLIASVRQLLQPAQPRSA